MNIEQEKWEVSKAKKLILELIDINKIPLGRGITACFSVIACGAKAVGFSYKEFVDLLMEMAMCCKDEWGKPEDKK